MSNISGILCFIISRKVKMQLKCSNRFVQCMEKVLGLIECVKSAFSCWKLLVG